MFNEWKGTLTFRYACTVKIKFKMRIKIIKRKMIREFSKFLLINIERINTIAIGQWRAY